MGEALHEPDAGRCNRAAGGVDNYRVRSPRGQRAGASAVRRRSGAVRATDRGGGAAVPVLIADCGWAPVDSQIRNPQSEIPSPYSVDLKSKMFGVPDGFPVITPAVAFVMSQSETVADGWSPLVAL